MIEVKGLTKYYGRHLAIEDLDFHAERGEILGFLGPNGAGKTTTMRILTGYMPPSAGSAAIEGFDVVDDSLEARCRIGYLPETVPLYPEMTVTEYLNYMGSLRGVRTIEDRIRAVLDQVGLSDRAHSFIGGLSKGLRQRVGLAQALIHEPRVLILDEPTIGLDPAQIIEVRNLIEGLGEDRTVLLSTHILSEAQQACDRVLIINEGRIVAEDSPDNLQAQLSGGQRLVVKVQNVEEPLEQRLLALDGVTEVRPGQADGELEVLTDGQQDRRADVARTVVDSGADLLELRTASYSLEEVFLQLTKDAPNPEGGR